VDELAHVMDVHPVKLLAQAYTDLCHGRDIDRLFQQVTQELSSIREATQDGYEKRYPSTTP